MMEETGNDDLAAFADALDRYLGEIDRDRDTDSLWTAIVGTFGLGGIGIPQARGGMGPATAEAMAVASAFGRAGLALPWGAHWIATRLSHDVADSTASAPLARNDKEAIAFARDADARDWATAAFAVAEAAEMTGLCETMLADTIAYSRERRQFGTAIATFQVLRHRIVDMQLALEKARAMTRVAALFLDGDAAGRTRWSGAARTLARDACRVVGEGAVQIHGAMGLTNELKLAKFFRQAVFMSSE